MRENVASTVLSKDDRPLPPRTNLTVEAAYTCLSHDAIELWLLRILATEVADLSFSIIGNKTRLLWRHRTTSLEGERGGEGGRRERMKGGGGGGEFNRYTGQFHLPAVYLPRMCLMTLEVVASARGMMHQRHCSPAERGADCFPPDHTAPACLGGLSPSTAEHHVHCGMPVCVVWGGGL